MKKNHSPIEKARLVLEAIQGESTINEIASRNSIHPNLLARWKNQAIKGLPHIFENETAKTHKMAIEYEKEKDALYKQIGKLTTQIEWLKKKSGF